MASKLDRAMLPSAQWLPSTSKKCVRAQCAKKSSTSAVFSNAVDEKTASSSNAFECGFGARPSGDFERLVPAEHPRAVISRAQRAEARAVEYHETCSNSELWFRAPCGYEHAPAVMSNAMCEKGLSVCQVLSKKKEPTRAVISSALWFWSITSTHKQ